MHESLSHLVYSTSYDTSPFTQMGCSLSPFLLPCSTWLLLQCRQKKAGLNFITSWHQNRNSRPCPWETIVYCGQTSAKLSLIPTFPPKKTLPQTPWTNLKRSLIIFGEKATLNLHLNALILNAVWQPDHKCQLAFSVLFIYLFLSTPRVCQTISIPPPHKDNLGVLENTTS